MPGRKLAATAPSVSCVMIVTRGVPQLTVISLLLGPVALVTGVQVRGFPGQSVTLPCRYSVGDDGKTEMCWGRGVCPSFQCDGMLIKTDGKKVTFATSQRYHLSSKIEEGDVSLTIKHLQREDSGSYCCRVEIPGWFNDLKVDLNLQVLEETNTSTTLSTNVFDTTQDKNSVTLSTPEGTQEILNSTDTNDGNTSTYDKKGNTKLYLGFGFLVLISLTGMVLMILKKLKNSIKEHNSNKAIELHMQQPREENIYQVSFAMGDSID